MGDGDGTDWDALTAEHIAAISDRFAAALARCGYDRVVIAAGELLYLFADDMPYPFHTNPQFLLWVPVLDAHGSFIEYTPGERPRLIHHQPKDYWHSLPEPASGPWTRHFDIVVIHDAEEAPKHLTLGASTAFLGDWHDRYTSWGVDNVNPVDLVRVLDFQRAAKTGLELACMRQASRLGVTAHRAAEVAYREGRSEFEINAAYLRAIDAMSHELPYGNIVALEEHGAVLHHQTLSREHIDAPRSFLIDAGARYHGYASDITRTYGWDADDDFAAMIRRMDALQLELCDMVRPGTDYQDIHLAAHRKVADMLVEFDIVTVDAEATYVGGITSTFLPHGVGHLIGLQTHDVAGLAADDRGGEIPRPEGHPYLRLTRVLEEDWVVTIEPGLYFIPLLLDELRASNKAAAVDWRRVADFLPYGGVRIEDDVRATAGDPENLTRDAFAA